MKKRTNHNQPVTKEEMKSDSKKAPIEQHYGCDYLAKLLSLNRKTIERAYNAGEFQGAFKMGVKILIPESTIKLFVASKQAAAPQKTA
jgi:hypothetical protein